MGLQIFAAIAVVVAILVVVLIIRRLVAALRVERAAQLPEDRSPLWLLIAAGIVAYLAAYFAYGGSLLAPLRLALIAFALGSFEVVRRLLR